MAIPENKSSRYLQVVLNVTQVYGKDKYGNPRTRERTLRVRATRERQYYVRGFGLKPKTEHYLFFNGERVNADQLRPRNWRYTRILPGESRKVYWGKPLVTDKRGRFYGYFMYRVNTPKNSKTLTDYYYLLNSITGRKYIILTDYAGESDFNIQPTEKASRQEYNSTLINFLYSSAASYAVDYVNVKARWNLDRWMNRRNREIIVDEGEEE